MQWSYMTCVLIWAQTAASDDDTPVAFGRNGQRPDSSEKPIVEWARTTVCVYNSLFVLLVRTDPCNV